MPRAMMIDPGTEPTWIDLDPANINGQLRQLLGGNLDFDVIHRDHGPMGPGVQLAVYEWSLKNGSPHNSFASVLLAGLGRSYHVHGRCVLMGLNGPTTVDLTVGQWEFLTALAHHRGHPVAPATGDES